MENHVAISIYKYGEFRELENRKVESEQDFESWIKSCLEFQQEEKERDEYYSSMDDEYEPSSSKWTMEFTWKGVYYNLPIDC